MYSANPFELTLPGFCVTADLVPWDTEVFGFPVAQIHRLEVYERVDTDKGWQLFQDWLDRHDIQLVSCRLAIDKLGESLFLERQSFRFIEVVLHPYTDRLDRLDTPGEGLTILPAEQNDLPELIAMAERAFRHERHLVDPRLEPRLGQLRYGRWVRTSLGNRAQQLLKILEGPRLISFFLVEKDCEGAVYWHLNAISPDWQGQGYGRKAWSAMLQHHRQEGVISVSTTISVRNIAVQNLYTSLGFRFLPPEMTFHWLRRDA